MLRIISIWKIAAAVLILLSSLSVQAQRTKGIVKDLEDADFESALEDLQKTFEKDSLDPSVSYLFAVLYATDSFPGQNLDTALMHYRHARLLLDNHLEDYDKELEKINLGEKDFEMLKKNIDSLAFEETKVSNKASSYQQYMSLYHDSRFRASARSLLHKLLFEEAESTDTWQAYQGFFEQNPAASQVELARERFAKLVYIDKTASGKLSDLEDFLIEYPTTPYRKEVETKIFDLKSANLRIDEIYDFINSYHNPKLTKQGMDVLYHLDSLTADRLKNFNLTAYEAFKDSVQEMELLQERLLMPFFEKNQFYFVDENGSRVIAEGYTDVSGRYLCRASESPVLHVTNEGRAIVVDRKGRMLNEGFDRIKNMGNGVVLTEKDGKLGAIHLTGFTLIPNEYDELTWIGSRLFTASKGGRLQLLNFGGEAVTDTLFDDIYLEGKYWIFEQDEKVAISNYDEISKSNGLFTPDFSRGYVEVELFEEHYLIAFDDVHEVMYNEELDIVTPPQTQRINTRFDIWVFQMAEGYWTFDRALGESSAVTYDDIQQNEEWLALKRNDQWEVHGKNLEGQPILAIDSVKLLGQDIAIVFRADQGMAIFPNKELVYINEGENLTSLRQAPGSSSHFLVRKHRGKNIVYRDGVKLFEADYDEVGFISEKAFSVKQYGKYGAVDDKGRLVMRVRYDAIGLAEQGVASVLYKGKFGGFNFDNNILLSLSYDHKIEAYNDSLFKVREDGLYGLITKKNVMAIVPDYEQIEYWSDSSFLAKQDDRWLLIKMSDESELLSGIISYSFIKNDQNEKIIWYQTDEGSGVYHSELGKLIPPVFNDVYNLGSIDRPFYFAERGFPEAEYNIVVYYNERGEKIKTAAYKDDEFEKVLCEDL